MQLYVGCVFGACDQKCVYGLSKIMDQTGCGEIFTEESLKGTRCLGSVELVFERCLKPFVIK